MADTGVAANGIPAELSTTLEASKSPSPGLEVTAPTEHEAPDMPCACPDPHQRLEMNGPTEHEAPDVAGASTEQVQRPKVTLPTEHEAVSTEPTSTLKRTAPTEDEKPEIASGDSEPMQRLKKTTPTEDEAPDVAGGAASEKKASRDARPSIDIYDFDSVLSGVTKYLRDAHQRALDTVMKENAKLKQKNAYVIAQLETSRSSQTSTETLQPQWRGSAPDVLVSSPRSVERHHETPTTDALFGVDLPRLSHGNGEHNGLSPRASQNDVALAILARDSSHANVDLHDAGIAKRQTYKSEGCGGSTSFSSSRGLCKPPEKSRASGTDCGTASSASSHNRWKPTLSDNARPDPKAFAGSRDSSRSASMGQSMHMQDFFAHEMSEKVRAQTLLKVSGANSASLCSFVFHAWASFVERMGAKLAFTPHDNWMEGTEGKTSLYDTLAIQKSASHVIRKNTEFAALHAEMMRNNEKCANGVMFPNSNVRMYWDLAGAFLLGYDVIMLPMSAFTNKRASLQIVMDWLALIFWTWDMVASCRTGYVHEGTPVMSPTKILKNYVRTWFILDLIVVVPDWVFTMTEVFSDSAAMSGSNSSKLLRALRVVRMSRVLRLVKINRLMSVLRDRIDSEYLFIFVNIIKLMLSLLVVNHFLASVWYAIGDLGMNLDAENWIERHNFKDRPLGERYTVALHWTLTQFTPASMDVQPQNTGERSFAICVLVSGLVLFSSFISSITNSMTQLRSMDDDKSKQFWLLRRYLRNHNIQANLAFRILRHVEFTCNEHRELIPEDKIWVLGLLSEQLRNELHFSVSYSCMSTHPLFDIVQDMSRMTMVRLCSTSLSIHRLAGTDVLFIPGTLQCSMHFLESGRLSYTHVDNSDSAGETLMQGERQWICEPAMWTQWVTVGDCHATCECKIVSIEVKSFGQVIGKDALSWLLVSKYATRYSSWLSTLPRSSLTDIFRNDQPFFITNAILEEVERLSDEQHKIPHKRFRSRGRSRGHSFRSMSLSYSKSNSRVSMISKLSRTTSKGFSKAASKVSHHGGGFHAPRMSMIPIIGKVFHHNHHSHQNHERSPRHSRHSTKGGKSKEFLGVCTT